jgi:hypothetical protein
MRQITKEEILASFGVPESVIGNAAGRTFSNASEEIRVFWMETMLPHLEPLARSLDELDEEYYVDFDTREVPILQLYKQERERYLMQEFQSGLISNNEYRTGSGRKEVEADLADSLLMNPNLIPIANTKKKMEDKPSVEMGGAPGAPVPGAPMPEVPMPGMEGQPPLDPNTMQGALAETQAPAAPAGPDQLAQSTIPPEALAAVATTAEPVPAGAASATTGEMMYKSIEDELQSKSTESLDRWNEILNRSIERVVERQQRVVLEKAGGSKAKKSLFAGTLEIDSILSPEVWDKQMDEDIRPVISAIIQDAYNTYNSAYGNKTAKTMNQSDLNAQINSQMIRIKNINIENFNNVSSIMFNSLSVMGEEERAASFRGALVSMYANLMAKQRFELAEDESRRAWKFGQFI